MKNFVTLPVTGYIININLICFIRPKYNEIEKWDVVFFNHTAMGTNNFVIQEKDYNYLIKHLTFKDE